ncbi:hypothetical protein F0L17_03045 [Streptomyces sp. TRM43335]|uniref:Transposase n=1 Tax=Streptomyces taklimakanensis TaxID=2569853 RepID=A0A6G2B888_9ACTN|nr:hypothetical protein [Streptomyces taklimakanensis]
MAFRRSAPAAADGDKGYDHAHLRRWLRSRGSTPRIAREDVDSSERLGLHHRRIERTFTWLVGCRRLAE